MKKLLAIISIFVLMAVFLASTQSFASAAVEDKKPTELPSGAIQKGNSQKGDDLPGQEKEKQNGKKFHFRGVIAAAAADSLTVTLPDGTAMTFVLGTKVKIKVPTLGKLATAADLKVGLQVTVQAEKKEAVYEALMINVVPGKPATGHHVGLVTAYTADTSLTVEDKKGVQTTFKLTAETQIILVDPALVLAVGSRVTVVAPRDLTSVEQTAKAIVVHNDKPETLKTAPTDTK